MQETIFKNTQNRHIILSKKQQSILPYLQRIFKIEETSNSWNAEELKNIK